MHIRADLSACCSRVTGGISMELVPQEGFRLSSQSMHMLQYAQLGTLGMSSMLFGFSYVTTPQLLRTM